MHVRLRFAFHEVELLEGTTTLGRDTSCTITLGGGAVSREHARIEIFDGTTTIKDLGSRTGVFVNGRCIVAPTTLADGNRIRIGTHEMVAQLGPLPPPSKRTTGKSLACTSCGETFSIERDACPACGTSLD